MNLKDKVDELNQRAANLGKSMAEQQGNVSRKNIYTCEMGHTTITVDRDKGVTPFMIMCTVPGCDCKAQSRMYQSVHKDAVATHEWYKPADLKGLSPWEKDHVKRGGLLMRKIKEVQS